MSWKFKDFIWYEIFSAKSRLGFIFDLSKCSFCNVDDCQNGLTPSAMLDWSFISSFVDGDS